MHWNAPIREVLYFNAVKRVIFCSNPGDNSVPTQSRKMKPAAVHLVTDPRVINKSQGRTSKEVRPCRSTHYDAPVHTPAGCARFQARNGKPIIRLSFYTGKCT